MTTFTDEVSAVERTVGRRTLAAGVARVSTVARTYPTDVADLWDACTSAERLARWFMPVEGELRVGGRYRLEGNAEGVVESCDPPHAFSATWEFGGMVSWITVRFSAVDEHSARFVLEHVAHVDDDLWAQFGPGATGIGWDLSLLGLAHHLADPDTRFDSDAVSASPQGREFVAGAAAAWRDAAVADGDDPATAAAAADRSRDFYTPA
jgi:uncharacterized protein YndB with AHSA1/START domain